jgi:hypothetical protein
MGEPKTIVFQYEEIIEALLKHQGIHEGIWGLHLEFGLNVANINVGSPGDKKERLVPGLVIPLLKIGITKTEKAGGISVDASKVNPSSKPQS